MIYMKRCKGKGDVMFYWVVCCDFYFVWFFGCGLWLCDGGWCGYGELYFVY